MDEQFAKYYERELSHLFAGASEFAREHPKIAKRIGINDAGTRPSDPYVERLLEGVAFLAARVQLKLDAEFPRFAQGLLQTVYPHYLAPTPSMAIVRLEPDFTQGSLAEGFDVKRGTVLRSTEFIGESHQTKCVYQTAHEVTLWPIEIAEAQYYTRDVAAIGLDMPKGVRAAIRIRLRALGGMSFNEIPMDRLTLYLRGAEERPMRIYEQLLAHVQSIVLRPVASPPPWQMSIPANSVQRIGFDEQHALLPYGPRSFHGYRLLQEYFAFPRRFLFTEIGNLADPLRRCEQEEIDLVFLLDQEDLELERVVDKESFGLYCTPAINLFEKRADRIDVSDRYNEFHVVPDRTCPVDYEVYEVASVTGFGSRSDAEQVFQPFYAATDFDAHDEGGAYFSSHRVPRVPSSRDRRKGRRRGTTYVGSEVYISLVDSHAAPYRADLRQLSVATLCTNRDLPLLMQTNRERPDFQLDQSAPVKGAWCEGDPTRPRPSPAHGELAWRLISHLTLNYLSLRDLDEHQGAAALRDLLLLYCDNTSLEQRKEIEGVKSVSSQPIVRRAVTPGPIAFARGLEVAITLDEDAFQGTGVFLIGAVLEQFLTRYVSINSFTETVIQSPRRGTVMRWPTRMGQRQIL